MAGAVVGAAGAVVGAAGAVVGAGVAAGVQAAKSIAAIRMKLKYLNVRIEISPLLQSNKTELPIDIGFSSLS